MTHDSRLSPCYFPFPVTDSKKTGRLLVVGTPIGNLEDFSPRGQRALS